MRSLIIIASLMLWQTSCAEARSRLEHGAKAKHHQKMRCKINRLQLHPDVLAETQLKGYAAAIANLQRQITELRAIVSKKGS